jgi:hypothetical protein
LSTLCKDAIRYAEMGYQVFPCAPGRKIPLTPHGFEDATTDIEQIDAWWREHPQANIAMPTHGLLVLDVDGPDNRWPGDPARVADLSQGAVSNTPRGGRHFIFQQPSARDWRNTVGKVAQKVDTRGNGGYIVLPPSLVNGVQYCWDEASPLGCPGDLPEPPMWLTALMDSLGGNGSAPGTPSGAHRSPQCDDPVPDGNTIPTGQRNDTLARLAGAMRRVGSPQKEILVALAQVNQDRCQPALTDREVERIAASIARYEPHQVTVTVAEQHWAQDAGSMPSVAGSAPVLSDPGPLPAELFRIPGFVSEVMDHCLATAPYPNVVMAFAGALALQAVLAGSSTLKSCTASVCRARSGGASPRAKVSRTPFSASRACCSRPTRSMGCSSRSTRLGMPGTRTS